MNKILLILLGTACISSAAMAQTDTRDVVRDERGQVIMNSFGNCVRTDWTENAGADACASTPEAAAPVASSATAEDPINKEMLNIYFGFDESTLSASSITKVKRLADLLISAKHVAHVKVVGYADPMGSNVYNHTLSQQRAQTVVNQLHQFGYQNASAVDIAAMGESTPVSQCNAVGGAEQKACLWRDRRVEVQVHYK